MMERAKLVAAFNEWMRQYLEDPTAMDERFKQLQQEFIEKQATGEQPSYGEVCCNFLEHLNEELSK